VLPDAAAAATLVVSAKLLTFDPTAVLSRYFLLVSGLSDR
jgi:hypothetical protein